MLGGDAEDATLASPAFPDTFPLEAELLEDVPLPVDAGVEAIDSAERKVAVAFLMDENIKPQKQVCSNRQDSTLGSTGNN